jgi:hypothetical protein
MALQRSFIAVNFLVTLDYAPNAWAFLPNRAVRRARKTPVEIERLQPNHRHIPYSAVPHGSED